MPLEFRTDAYDATLGATAADISTKWSVKQLASAKVHRLNAEIPAPKGDLIITEFFNGAELSETAWEFYNPTDVPINLKDYYIQRFDYGATGYPSEDSPSFESNLLPDRELLFKPYSSSIDKDANDPNRGILPPHKSVVFYTAGVTNKGMVSQMKNRAGLAYLFNIGSTTLYNLDKKKQNYAKAFWSAWNGKNRSRHRIVRKEPQTGKYAGWGSKVVPVDVFFWYNDGTPAQYPTASFFRKPGRDLPRQEMQITHNSDWLMRHRYEALDWGYRFSYYFDRDRLVTDARGAHWVEDRSTGATIPGNSTQNGYVLERPIFAPDYSAGTMDFKELKKQAKKYQYTPPMWWTKERALAADR